MITHLRKTEQTGHALETEIVAGIFPPVSEYNTENIVFESYSALKIFVTVIDTLLNPIYTHQILDGNKIEPPYTENRIYMAITISWAYLNLWLSFLFDMQSKLDKIFELVFKF